jgi:hypothetical protein
MAGSSFGSELKAADGNGSLAKAAAAMRRHVNRRS